MESPLKNADNEVMLVKPLRIIILGVLLLGAIVPLNSYYVTYKEQFYRLYHIHYNQYPDDTIENIHWLEQAMRAQFCNPRYALATIENETQYEKYQYLFNMHLNLKLIEQHLFLGNKFNKRHAYFFNAPWKRQNLESLETAETCFRAALCYWDAAAEWAEKAREKRFYFINLEKVQFWEDEALRIEEGSLNYAKIINRELGLLQKVREAFEAMPD